MKKIKKIVALFGVCVIALSGCTKQDNNPNPAVTTATTSQSDSSEVLEYDESKLILQDKISPIYISEEIKFTDNNKDVLKIIAKNITELKLRLDFSNYDFNIENFSYETHFMILDANDPPFIITDYKGNNSIGWVGIYYSGDNYSIYGSSYDENIVAFKGAVDGEEIQVLFGDGDGTYFETFIKSDDCLIKKKK